MHQFSIHDRMNDLEIGFNEGEPIVLGQPTGTAFEVSMDDPEVSMRWEELKEQVYGFVNFLRAKRA